jgi:hypothetical protein
MSAYHRNSISDVSGGHTFYRAVLGEEANAVFVAPKCDTVRGFLRLELLALVF